MGRLPSGEEITPPAAGWWELKVNAVAEVQYFIRPNLRRMLKGQILSTAEEIQPFTGGVRHWLELWEGNFGQQFFDMSTLVRLATTTEVLLRDYYRACFPGRIFPTSWLTRGYFNVFSLGLKPT